MHTIGFQWLKFSYREDGINLHRMVDILKYLSQYYVPVFFFIIAIGQICTALKILSSFYGIVIIIIIIIIIIITLFNEGKDIDYWSPSSFHNGPPNQIKSNQIKSNVVLCCELSKFGVKNNETKKVYSPILIIQTSIIWISRLSGLASLVLVFHER